MRTFSSLAVIVFCFAMGSIPEAKAAPNPTEVAGFRLGADISQYQDLIDQETAIPVADMRFLTEVNTKPALGYEKGTVVYGTCTEPGEIVRIKMKYADSSKQFYESLLNAFKKKFGRPSEWRGDAFHHFIAWKWSFKNSNKDSINMILQHAVEGNLDHPDGNVIKLTNWTAVERERQCHAEKSAQSGRRTPTRTKAAKELPGIEYFVPR